MFRYLKVAYPLGIFLAIPAKHNREKIAVIKITEWELEN